VKCIQNKIDKRIEKKSDQQAFELVHKHQSWVYVPKSMWKELHGKVRAAGPTSVNHVRDEEHREQKEAAQRRREDLQARTDAHLDASPEKPS